MSNNIELHFIINSILLIYFSVTHYDDIKIKHIKYDELI